MLVRGVVVSYETIRRWCAKFGQAYANQLRRRRPAPRRQVAPRRGVRRDQRQHSGTCGARSTSTATCSTFWSSRAETRWPPSKFFRKLLKGLRYVPRVLVTDKLASYQVAHRELMPSVEHRRSRYLNIHTEFAGARPSPR